MLNKLYSIKDRIAGEYGPIYMAKNHDVARRMYGNMAEANKINTAEYDLYYLGDFDSESGVIFTDAPIEVSKSVQAEE